MREETEYDPEHETRSFQTPTKPVKRNFTQGNDPCTSRNMVTGVLNDQKRAKKDLRASQRQKNVL